MIDQIIDYNKTFVEQKGYEKTPVDYWKSISDNATEISLHDHNRQQ